MPSDAIVLAFDTSAAHCAAALVSGDRLLACTILPMDKGQAEQLMPLLEGMLADHGLRWRDLTALGVGTGPGNFTGTRIAVSAARGLALALTIPAIGISGFEAAALGLPRPLLASVDARRGQSYLARLDDPSPPRLLTPDSLPPEWHGLDVVGHDAAAFARVTSGAALAPVYPLPEAIARIAQTRRLSPQPRPAPLYLRAADAAPPSDPPPHILA